MAQTVARETPTPYQEALFVYAKDNDCIINIPTGAEKTCIATLLMKRFADELQGDLGKRMFFLVQTKPLVAQEAAEIRRETTLNVAEFTGRSYITVEHNNIDTAASDNTQQDSKSNWNINIAHWDSETWIQMLKDIQVAVISRHIFLNALKQKLIPLDRIHSIIFDEAHHAVSSKTDKNTNDPYKLIMDIVNDAEKIFGKPRPRIWGLTSVLSQIEDPETSLKLVEMLEDIFKAPCISAELQFLGKHGTSPTEELELHA